MTTTIVARLADQLGHAQRTDVTSHDDGRRVEARRRSWASTPASYRRTQPATIYVDLDHDPGSVVGEVVALEDDGQLWMVARSDHDELLQLSRPVYASVETDSNMDGTDVVLTGVGLCYRSAAVCAQPVTFVPGDIAAAAAMTTGRLHDLIARARDYRFHRPPGAPHMIITPRRSTERRSLLEDVPNVWVDGRGRIITRTPPGRRTAAPRLLAGHHPIGRHDPTGDGPGITAFTPLRTQASRDAVVLVTDGVLDEVVVHRSRDGWRAVELRPA